MKPIDRRVPILALTLALAALACNLPGIFATATPEFAAFETLAQQTLSARLTQGVPTVTPVSGAPSATAPAVTATLQPTQAAATLPPTLGVVPTVILVPPTPAINFAATAQAQAWPATQAARTAAAPPPLPSAGHIRFAQGATSGQVAGSLPGGAEVDYLIGASGGQTMLVSVFSPNNDVYLGVSGVSDGSPLLRTAAGATTFTGALPATQDYRLALAAPPQGSAYTLQVIIPARIQFAPGAISASLPGRLAGGEVNYYLARAAGGQTMTARILAPNQDIFLTIYGMSDGSPLVRSVMGLTEWSGALPITQDYMIQAVSTGGPAGYTLEVTIR